MTRIARISRYNLRYEKPEPAHDNPCTWRGFLDWDEKTACFRMLRGPMLHPVCYCPGCGLDLRYEKEKLP